MKKVLIALLILFVLVAAIVGVWNWRFNEKPERALLRIVATAMLGDEQGFLDGFTADSRGLVAAVLHLSRGEDLAKSPRHPYYYLVTENIVDVNVLEGGAAAHVRVRRPGDDKSKGYDIPMVRECDDKYLYFKTVCLLPQWKIDGKHFDGRPLDRERRQ